MSEVKDPTSNINKNVDKHNTAASGLRPLAPPGLPTQQRPQFQAGGPVTNPPQYISRPAVPATRGPAPPGPALSHQSPVQRSPAPAQRPSGPQSVAPQLPLRPPQSPQGQILQRAPPPNNLQFGPRQPSHLGVPTTPDGSKPLLNQIQNGVRNGTPVLRPLLESQRVSQQAGLLPRQSSQGTVRGPEISDPQKNKSSILDNQSVDNFNVTKSDNEISANMSKSRSYSIAAAPGAPSPLKMEDDRRKSVSSFGGKIEELSGRTSVLGSIHEGKSDFKESGIHDSRESVKMEGSNNRDICDRPESRMSGSKMTESFIGSLGPSTPKKKIDDDDDVVSRNKKAAGEGNKTEILDRSPSLTRSDESPEPKQQHVSPVLSNKGTPKQCITPEPQRTKTPIENKTIDHNKEINPSSVSNVMPKSSLPDAKPSTTPNKKPTELYTDAKKCTTPRKITSAPKSRAKDGDNDSGVDESTQGNEANGSPESPNKKTPSKLPTKEKSSNGLPTLSRSSSKSATAKTPETPVATEKKKVPMNKVQVGNAPSPNLKSVKSKIGSLDNSTYKPGGGKVKIENRKLDFQKVTPRIAAKNDAYVPSGGTKKIPSAKLEWNAKSKIGSLQNSSYKPGGGDKKIETVKLDFKEKAKPKVASTVNITHKPGGGAVKIENQKLDFKAQSKVGSLDNVKHKPGGGDVKIFDDKDYIKNVGSHSPALTHSGQESPVPQASHAPQSDENLNQQQ